MSGRSLHLRDGQLITNRKTDRRQGPRSEPVEKELSFYLPTILGLTPPGYHGVVATRVEEGGRVVVNGKGDPKWMFGQAVELLRRLIGKREIPKQTIPATLAYAAERAPTDLAPARPAHCDGYTIQIAAGGKVHVVSPAAKDAWVFE